MNGFTRLVAVVRRRRDADRPSPLLAALPQLCIAVLALALGFGAGIAWRWVLAIAGALVAVALLQAARAAAELGRRRRAADEWLLWGATARPSSALLGWRAAELMSPRLRATLANSLARIERETRGKTLPGAVPLNKRALRCHLGLLCILHGRLDDRSRPVTVRGILLVDRLLTEPKSPLYAHAPEDVLAEALSDALAALEPGSLAAAA